MHMLNEQSRKYFHRAFVLSNTAFSPFAIRRANHIRRIRKCTKIFDITKMVKYLKKAKAETLTECYPYKHDLNPTWVPTIERNRGFLTRMPDEIYNSNKAPIMDAMFSFTAKEILLFLPYLWESEEPILKRDWIETDPIFELPFEGVTKSTHPNVNSMILFLLFS